MNSLNCDRKMTQNLNILQEKRILLYGAGINFEKLINDCPLLDLNIIAIADIKFTETSKHMGLKAISPSDILNHNFDAILITVVQHGPIIKMLRDQLNIEQDIYYFQNNMLSLSKSKSKIKLETDSDTIIKLLSEINASLKELLPNKNANYHSKFSPRHMLTRQAAEQTLEYINKNASNALVLDRNQVYKHCLNHFLNKEKNPQDLFLEFGVYKGGSINFCSNILPERKFYGFDSFEGLPSDWAGYAVKKGEFTLSKKLPEVNKNVELIDGWFEDTLPAFLKQHTSKIAFLHIDCDLYSSTKTILNNLGSRIEPGTIIIFDEYFNYPNWQEHEYKAFQEFVKDNNIKYEYIAFSHTQMALRIL